MRVLHKQGSAEMHLQHTDTDMSQQQIDAAINVSAADARVANCIDEFGNREGYADRPGRSLL